MVSPEKVSKKFNLLEEYLRILEQISQTPEEEFLKDKILIGSAKYYIQISIECCIDVATHIISSEGFRSPRNMPILFAFSRKTEFSKRNSPVVLFKWPSSEIGWFISTGKFRTILYTARLPRILRT